MKKGLLTLLLALGLMLNCCVAVSAMEMQGGTITLLLVYASWLVTILCLLIRFLHSRWRKKHPPEPEYIDAEYYQEVIDLDE